jgi:hypothetical protein
MNPPFLAALAANPDRSIATLPFVAIGSPGLAIDDQSALGSFYSNSSSLYAARTPGDPIAGTNWDSFLLGNLLCAGSLRPGQWVC